MQINLSSSKLSGERGIAVIKKFKNAKIRTQFTLLLIIMGTISFSLFQFLWYKKWNAYELLKPVFHLTPPHGDAEFFDLLRKEAPKYDIPKSEKDMEAIEKLQPFFNLSDKYTSVYIYGSDGFFRTGKYAESMDDNLFRAVFDLGYRMTGGEGEGVREFTMDFHNGKGLVRIYYYHNIRFLYPYALFCVGISSFLFLGVILFFISRKIRQIILIQTSILQMSSGDLKTPTPKYGEDEIGILSSELDKLRVTLSDTLQQEQESRQANQDLITAMSHDLRTPLTILNGYLEVLKLGKNPDMQDEYLSRCLQKTKDIKELTDRMFEYALVFEEIETPKTTPVPYFFFWNCLLENFDFLKLAGFQCVLNDAISESELCFTGDETMLKRIFNNLFSNVLKYGEKSAPVILSLSLEHHELKIQLQNKVKESHTGIDSNHIGLKSVEKMMALLGGRMLCSETEQEFTIILTFLLS